MSISVHLVSVRRLWATVLVFGCLATILSAKTVTFDIPAQPAASALQLFGRQAGVEVVYPSADLKKIQAAEVKGELEADAALARLLAGTGYLATKTSATSFVVTAPVAQGPGSIEGSVREERSGRPVAGAKVSLAGTDVSVLTDRRGRFTLEGVSSGEQVLLVKAEGIQDTKVTDVTVRAGHRLSLSAIGVPVKQEGPLNLDPYVVSAKKNDGVLELDPYAVEGSKPKPFSTANIDLTRTREDALPFTTFSAKEIQNSGATNLEDFLRLRLTQSMSTSIVSERNTQPNITQAGPNIRGLLNQGSSGTSETLVLVNGRRTPQERYVGTSIDGPNRALYLGVPLSAIERIELLPSAGGALYGANSTTAIFNIITRQDFKGGQISARYEDRWEGHAPNRSIDFTYGMPLTRGFSLRMAAGYGDSRPLQVSDRADVLFMPYRNAIVGLAPELLGQQYLQFGLRPNIFGTELFGPGTPGFTSVPAGYTGGQGIAPFSSRQGVLSLDLPSGQNNPSRGDTEANLTSRTRDENLMLAVDKQFSNNWRTSLEFHHFDNETRNKGFFYENSGLTVPAAAPTNPFGKQVRVFITDPHWDILTDPNQVAETGEDRLVFSTRGQIKDWLVLLDLSALRTRYQIENRQLRGPVNGMSAALLSGAYNPFVDPLVAAPATPQFYRESILQETRQLSETRDYARTLKLSGAVWEGVSGPISLTMVADWNTREKTKGRVDQRSTNFATNSLIGTPLNRVDEPNNRFEADSKAVAFETTAPLLGNGRRFWIFDRLELFVSGRGSEERLKTVTGSASPYTPVEFVTHPTLWAYGFRLDAAPGVALRASRSIGFRPPTFAQITPSLPSTFPTTVTDPRRGNQSVTLSGDMYISGGSLDLQPETSTADNVGIIVRPRSLEGFRFSLDYVTSRRDDAITTMSPQSMLTFESDFPDRVRRGASDGHPSGVGPISHIDARNVNFAQVISKSVDLLLEQSFSNVLGGRLTISGAATKNLSLITQATSTAARIEQVRRAAFAPATVLEWNANAQIVYDRRNWTAGWTTRYSDDIPLPPTVSGSSVPITRLIGSDRAGDAFDHDAFVSYRTDEGSGSKFWRSFLAHSTVTLGVKNVFNRRPRFIGDVQPTGFDSYLGRSVWLQIRRDL